MPIRAVALLSGGLDSMLAVRILQKQGIEVEALNFRTVFTCCQERSAQAAEELGVRLTVLAPQEDYLEVIRSPKHGYGRGANPCVDCRIYMFRLARTFMQECRASVVISGEVVGQRPMSQKKRDLAVIAHHSGLDGQLLRPLSAKLLPPTEPERSGEVDRERLFGFSGRSRKGLIELAQRFGFRTIPQPSTGCMLTEPGFAPKVFDLIQLEPNSKSWDFELLKVGRHARYDTRTKVVVGRREEENERLRRLFERKDASPAVLVSPEDFVGPLALIVGPLSEETIEFAGGLVLRYSKPCDRTEATVRVENRQQSRTARVMRSTAALAALNL